MKIKAICLGIMAAVMMVVVSMPSSNAGECEYGTVQAWARTLNDDGSWGEWQNATVHANLKVHEPFQVKVKVTTKVDIPWLDIWLERAGTTKAYEVTEGPTNNIRGGGVHGNTVSLDNVPAGWSGNYEWILRPTGNWTEGMAVLNVGSSFSTMEDDKFVDFTIIAAYIENEEWSGNGGNDGGDNNGDGGSGGIPGFESMAMMTAFIVAPGVIFISKRRKKYQNDKR